MVISQLFIYENNLFTSYFYNKHINLLCQETFPINGVENNYKSPIAFINAKIHQSSSKVIENGMMLVQDDKILSLEIVSQYQKMLSLKI